MRYVNDDDVLKVVNRFIGYLDEDMIERIKIAIKKDVPTLERPHGEWEHWGSPFTDECIANSIVCSLCKARYVEIEGACEVFNFCPHCGADMRGDMDG